MELLTTPKEIENMLCVLMKSYKTISFASAWASGNSKAFKMLLKNKNKINKIVVGIHFYQTNPNFINEFTDNKKVKFITNPSGVFHPKIYLFSNSNEDWKCLIGSANFTKSALEKNSEIMICLSDKDIGSNEVYTRLTNEIDEFYRRAKIFTKNDLMLYQKVWDKKAKHILDLKDKFGSSNSSKPIYQSKIIMLDWNKYYDEVKNDKNSSFYIRLELLRKAKKYFTENTFHAMTDIQRKQIAGIVKRDMDNTELDWMYFGHMASPRFKKRISDEYINISKALEYIPSKGIVQKEDYMKYIDYFKNNSNYGYGVPTISRLLSMKRPDVFFCLTGGNEQKLYIDFGIEKIDRKEYERYWDEIIQRIHKAEWFNVKKPKDSEEKELWINRVAMLDAIFYDGDVWL